ncbi:MAG: FeoA family protein [Candidatus Edwardsbacteria bacterium]
MKEFADGHRFSDEISVLILWYFICANLCKNKMDKVDLTRMKSGEKGKVVEIKGGRGLVMKLEAMGIRPGVEITKISAQIMHGPVIVRVGNTQLAIGFGMAKKVIVTPQTEEDQ